MQSTFKILFPVFVEFHPRRSPRSENVPVCQRSNRSSLAAWKRRSRPGRYVLTSFTPNLFPCHTSENSPVSPSIATLPKTRVSNPCVCHTSETPGGSRPRYYNCLRRLHLCARLGFMSIAGQRAKMEVVRPPRGVNSPRTTHHSGRTAATTSRRILLTAFS